MNKLLTFFFIVNYFQVAFGCMCLYEKIPSKNDIEVEIITSDWIGVGKIIEENNDNHLTKYKLETYQIYKGKQGKIQLLASRPGDCGFKFKKNIEYLIYGNKKDDGEIEVSYCSRTIKLDRTADLNLLDYYLLGKEYPSEMTFKEDIFIKNVVGDSKANFREVRLFFHKNKLISKKDFFSLNPIFTKYELRRLSSGDLKMISPKVRREGIYGILIAYKDREKKLKRYKLIRKINRFLKK